MNFDINVKIESIQKKIEKITDKFGSPIKFSIETKKDDSFNKVLDTAGNPKAEEYKNTIRDIAGKVGLDPDLIKSVIQAESNFDKDAVSPKGAQGLMQLMPQTAQLMNVEDPFNPEDNILGGSQYLKSLIGKYGNLELALAAYNAGPEAVDKYKGIPPFEETQNYVKKILQLYRK